MRRQSKQTAARERACREFRRQLIMEVRCCELCGHDPGRPGSGRISWALLPHEIARGPSRQAALDKRFAILVLCYLCHVDRIHGNEDWPEARQLAVVKRSRPQDFDLAAYNKLKGYGPNRITEEDVDQCSI